MTDVKSTGVAPHEVAVASGNDETKGGVFTGANTTPQHGEPQVIGAGDNSSGDGSNEPTVEDLEAGKKGWFAYLRTRNFYVVLVAGFVFSFPFHMIRN